MFPTSNQLIIALCVTIGVLVASTPIFIESLQEQLLISFYVWAPVFVVSNFRLESQEVVSFSVQALLNCWFGCGFGFLSYYMSGFIVGDAGGDLKIDSYERHAIAVAFVGCIMPFFRGWDIAMFVAYSVSAFSGEHCLLTVISIGIYSVGAFTTVLLLFLAFTLFPRSRKRNSKREAMDSFRLMHTLWFEGLFDYFSISTCLDVEEMNRRQAAASASLSELLEVLAIIKADPLIRLTAQHHEKISKVSEIVFRINSELVSIRGCLSKDGFSRQVREGLGADSLLLLVDQMHYSILTVLRPHSNSKICENACLVMQEQMVDFEYEFQKLNRLGDSVFTSGNDHNPSIGANQTENIFRFYFLISRIGKLGSLSRQLVLELETFDESIDTAFNTTQTSVISIKVVIKIIRWLFNESYLKVPKTKSDFLFILKSILTNQVLTQVVLFLKYRYQEDITLFSYFSVVASTYLVTSLSSLGAVLLGGTRRFFAITAAAAVSSLLFVIGPSTATIFLILTIVSFSGKLNLYNPVIGVAAVEFVNAFIYNVLPLYDGTNGGQFASNDTNFILGALYRGSCILIGFAYAMICASLIYPNYDSDKFRDTFGQTIKELSNLFCDSLSTFSALYKGKETNIFVSEDELNDRFTLIMETFKILVEIRDQSRAESLVLSKRRKHQIPVSLSKIISSEDQLYKVAGRAFSFSLVCQEAMTTTREEMNQFTDPEQRKILMEILDFIDRIGFEFNKASDLTICALLNPREFPPQSTMANCIVEWSEITNSIFNRLVLFNSSDFEPSSKLVIFRLQNIVFATILFLTAWDSLIFALHPSSGYRHKKH
jgi:hypothetical protein